MEEDRLVFQSFASGSSGNCYYVGTPSSGILIDAGIGVRLVRKHLKKAGIESDRLRGIFVTHDHVDHIRGLGALVNTFHLPVYATRLTHQGIRRSYCVTRDLSAFCRCMEKGETVEAGDLSVTAFPVSHDATDSVGYTIECRGKRITFATDLGCVETAMLEQMTQADYLVLEANYDETMLLEGSYPHYLKQRIMAQTGHLSNEQAACCLSEHWHERLKHVFLCHLSRENNKPELACETVRRHLQARHVKVGSDVELTALERTEPSMLYDL